MFSHVNTIYECIRWIIEHIICLLSPYLPHHLVLLVLSCIWKAGNNGSDSSCWCNLAGIDHNEKFHDHVVYLPATTLNDKHIFSTNRLSDLYTTSIHNNHWSYDTWYNYLPHRPHQTTANKTERWYSSCTHTDDNDSNVVYHHAHATVYVGQQTYENCSGLTPYT